MFLHIFIYFIYLKRIIFILLFYDKIKLFYYLFINKYFTYFQCKNYNYSKYLYK